MARLQPHYWSGAQVWDPPPPGMELIGKHQIIIISCSSGVS